MKKTIKKFLIGVGSMATMLNVLTGCVKQEEKQIKLLEESITQQLNTAMQNNEKLITFDVLAVEVEKNGFNFDVAFNGIATHEEQNQKFYAAVDYNVSSKYFSDLNNNSNKEKMFKAFNIIVNEHDIKNYSLTPISEFSKINNAIIKNTPSPFEKYSIRSGIVYNISMPDYNDETKEISFDAKMLTKLVKSLSDVGVGIGFSSAGGVGIGVGVGFSSSKSLINIVDNYKIDARNLNYEEFKASPEKVFDYLIESINKKDASQIKANRVYVNAPGYQYANTIGNKNIKNLKNQGQKNIFFEL